MNIYVLTIGDEILIGQIIDTNSAWMGQTLNDNGARIVGILSVSDEVNAIQRGLDMAFEQADIVLMTGGLGPTKDDVTKKAIAEYYQVGMTFSEPTYDRIVKLFAKWGRSTTEAHRLQCYMPENALLLYNKMGTAPGMWFERNGKVLVSMPGVPYEMKYLVEYEVIPKLLAQFQKEPIAHRTIHTIGEGESRIAVRIADFEKRLPPHIKLAYLPSTGKVRLRLTGTGREQVELERELDELVEAVKPTLDDLIFGYGRTTIAEAIGQLLKAHNLMLATAESCTGGYVAHQITAIPGSSAYFAGSVVAYSNEVKVSQLGVNTKTLIEHGAVSEQTVREMLAGLLTRYPADVGISISGIAGPTGGTPEKPVGTIWVAVGNQSKIHTKKLQLGKDRMRNIQFTAVRAFDMLRLFILGKL